MKQGSLFWHVLIGGVALMGLSFAAPTPTYRPLRDGAAVAWTVDTAVNEVFVASEVLRGRAVAEALRRATVERGVHVFILAPSTTVNERASFYRSLTLAGATIRIGEVPSAQFLVVDRRVSVTGPLVGGLTAESGGAGTVRSNDPRYVGTLVQAFVRLFARARVFQTKVGR